jgi:hypothetical protein
MLNFIKNLTEIEVVVVAPAAAVPFIVYSQCEISKLLLLITSIRASSNSERHMTRTSWI